MKLLTFHESLFFSISEALELTLASEGSALVLLTNAGLYVSQLLFVEVFFTLSPSFF